MKTKHVVLASQPGITAAVATRLASAIKNMHSVVILNCGEQFACARNILGVLALCAAVGSTVEVQTFGEDEGLAAETVEMILADSGDKAAK